MKFLIGSNHVPFSISDVTIELDTYLSIYLAFPGRHITQEVEVEDPITGKTTTETYHVLEDLDPDLFKEFAAFLNGGDFLWNDDVINFFSFMGYINTMDYPLDFWKVKLRDNWIRNNFYRLELWNPNSTLSDLLIERGPYVGLVDITDKFIPMFISKPRILPKDLGILNEVINFDDHIILAGGALISFLMDFPRMPPDLDLFITTKDQKVAEDKIKELIANYHTIRYQDSGNRPKFVIDKVMVPKIVVTHNSLTIGDNKPKLQVILRLYTSPSEVVHGFDLDASGLLYNGESIWATYRAAYSIDHKINFFDFDRMSETYGYRLAKYASRGFKVWMPRFDLEKVRWDDLEKIAVCADRNLTSSYYWRISPAWYPLVEDMTNIKNVEEAGVIFSRKNPIDLIIWAMYFNYLPKLPLSDYDKKSEEAIGKFTRFPRGPEVENPSWWEMAGPGFVVFSQEYKSIPIEPIFKLSPDVAQISGLPVKLCWKEQDPMAQLTGTFNPTKLENLNMWFDQAYLYEGIQPSLYPEQHFPPPVLVLPTPDDLPENIGLQGQYNFQEYLNHHW